MMNSLQQLATFFISPRGIGVVALMIVVSFSIYRINVKKLSTYKDSILLRPAKLRFTISCLVFCLVPYLLAVLFIWLIDGDFPYEFAWAWLFILTFQVLISYPYYTIAIRAGSINGPALWGWLWKRTEIRLDDLDMNGVSGQRLGRKIGITVIPSNSGVKLLSLGLDGQQLSALLAHANSAKL